MHTRLAAALLLAALAGAAAGGGGDDDDDREKPPPLAQVMSIPDLTEVCGPCNECMGPAAVCVSCADLDLSSTSTAASRSFIAAASASFFSSSFSLAWRRCRSLRTNFSWAAIGDGNGKQLRQIHTSCFVAVL